MNSLAFVALAILVATSLAAEEHRPLRHELQGADGSFSSVDDLGNGRPETYHSRQVDDLGSGNGRQLHGRGFVQENHHTGRRLQMGMGGMMMGRVRDRDRHEDWRDYVGRFRCEITNMSKQHFSPIFVFIANDDADPLYELNEPASTEMRRLAEEGVTGPLEAKYKDDDDLLVSGVRPGFGPSKTQSFSFRTTYEKRYLSFASMCINSNDCFIGGSQIVMYDGLEMDLQALDAGTEENDELCDSVPGPACSAVSGNRRSLKGEGTIQIHPGIHGDGGLSRRRDDWRNPIATLSCDRLE